MSHNQPKPILSDEEIFALLTMTYGKPPATRPGYARTREQSYTEALYYNGVTSMLFAMNKDIVWVNETRARFYGEHGIFLFDSVGP